MNTEIIAVYKASESPCILNKIVRARMFAAVQKWDNCDGDVDIEYQVIAGNEPQIVVIVHPSITDQAGKLIRRISAAMKS